MDKWVYYERGTIFYVLCSISAPIAKSDKTIDYLFVLYKIAKRKKWTHYGHLFPRYGEWNFGLKYAKIAEKCHFLQFF